MYYKKRLGKCSRRRTPSSAAGEAARQYDRTEHGRPYDDSVFGAATGSGRRFAYSLERANGTDRAGGPMGMPTGRPAAPSDSCARRFRALGKGSTT